MEPIAVHTLVAWVGKTPVPFSIEVFLFSPSQEIFVKLGLLA